MPLLKLGSPFVIEWLQLGSQSNQPEAVGHRVVHGGQKFIALVLIDDAAMGEIEGLSELAPLHNPGAITPTRKRSSPERLFGCSAHERFAKLQTVSEISPLLRAAGE